MSYDWYMLQTDSTLETISLFKKEGTVYEGPKPFDLFVVEYVERQSDKAIPYGLDTYAE